MTIEIGARSLHDIRRMPPLPPYARARQALDRALPALQPPERISVTEAAERYMMVSVAGQWQRFDRGVAPYMVEPTDLCTSRRFRRIVFVGPSQCGKTQMLLGCAVHAIMCDPGAVQFVHQTAKSAKRWVLEKFEPVLRHSPDLAARGMTGRAADNLDEKRFIGGAEITIGPATADELSSRTRRLMLLTEYDALGDDIGGEGSAAVMADRRTLTFGSRGMTLIETSPRRDVIAEDWKPDPARPHEAPPVEGGALAIYNEGTRGRWYWACPDCAGEFEPRFSLLTYPRDADPVEAGAEVAMGCPHCGTLIGPEQKPALNAAGRWLHAARDGSLQPITADNLAGGDLATYWLQGVAAAFSTWGGLVTEYERARRTFDATGNDGDLRTATNTGLGEPYLPRGLSGSSDIEAQALRDAALDYPSGICPAGTRFVTVAVDVQDSRFVVQVEAWGVGLSRVVIDRRDIVTPPEGAPDAGGRSIAPPLYGEDWAALLPLVDEVWPVEGSTYGLRPAGVVIDSGGSRGVTPHAYAFWRARRKSADRARHWHLIKGFGGARRDRVERVFIETRAGGEKSARKDTALIQASTDALKDEVAAALSRGHEGARSMRLVRGLPRAVADEMAAERRGPKGWAARPGVKRNEAFDCAVYALALVYVLRGDRIDWDAAPDWAMPPEANSRGVALAAAPSIPGRIAPEVPPFPARVGPAEQPAPATAPDAKPAALRRRRRPMGRRHQPWPTY